MVVIIEEYDPSEKIVFLGGTIGTVREFSR